MTLQVEIAHYLAAHKDCIYAIEKNTDSSFYTAGGDGMLLLWDLENPLTAQMLAKTDASIYVIKKIDLSTLLLATNNGSVYIINTNTKAIIAEAKIDNTIFDVAFYKNVLILTQAKGFVTVLDAKSLQILKSAQLCTAHIRKIIPNNNGQFIIGSSDGSITCINPALEIIWKQEKAHNDSVFALLLLKSTVLISGGKDAFLKQWNLDESGLSLQNEVPAHLFAINDLILDTENWLLYTASRDKSIKIWEPETLLLKKVIDRSKITTASSHSVNRLLWLNQNVIAVGDDRIVRNYRIKY